MIKLIVVSVFAATLVQCDNPTHSEGFIDGGVSQNWRDVFEAYAEQIRNSTDSSKEILFDLQKNLQQRKEQIFEQLSAKLKSEGTTLLQEFNELREQARVLGIDIQNCIPDGEQRIIDIPVNFTQEISGCQAGFNDEGNAVINLALSATQDATEDLNVLVNKFDNCYEPFAFKCQAEVTAQAGSAATSISVDLSGLVKGVTIYISGLEESLQSCGFSKIYIALSEGRRIIKNVSRCVDSNVKPILLN